MQIDLADAWKPYDRQARFIGSDALFTYFLAGVGSGKSYSLAAWIVRKVLQNGRATGALLGRTGGDLHTVLLPELFDRLDEVRAQTGFELVRDIDRYNSKIRFVNGGTLYYRPYNRIAKIRGLTLTYAAADEVEFAEADLEDVWSVLTGRLRGKGPVPGLAFASSPNGLRGITKKFHDQQLLADDAIASGDAKHLRAAQRYRVVTATSFDNPYLPDHYFESLRSMSKKRYQQEVLGRVLRPVTSVFELTERHVVDPPSRQFRVPWVCGIDWGAGAHHVALKIECDRDGVWFVADELIVDDAPLGKFLERLYRWIEGDANTKGHGEPALFGVDRAIVEANQALQRRYRGVQVRWMESRDEQKVTRGLEAVRDMLDPWNDQPRLVFSRRLAHVTRGETAPILPAMRGYRYGIGRDGVPTTKPQKDNIHDHAVDALRYAVVASSGRIDLHGGRRWIIDLEDTPRRHHDGPGHSDSQT